MSIRFFFFLCFFVQCALALSVKAEPLLLADTAHQPHWAKNLAILQDATGKLSPEDLVASHYQKQFIQFNTTQVDLGYTDSVVWLRLDIQQVTDLQLLSIYSSGETKITPYLLTQATPNTGFIFQALPKLDSYLFPSYKLPLTKSQQSRFYIRLSNAYAPISFNVELLSEQQALENSYYCLLRFGFILGGMVALALYNLFLFLSFRDRSYLNLVGFIVCLIPTGTQHLLPSFIGQDVYILLRSLTPLLATAFGLQFFRYLMQTTSYMPTVDKILQSFVFLALALIILSPFIHITMLISGIIGLILLPLVIAITCQAFLSGYRVARSFIWAVAVLFLTAMPNILTPTVLTPTLYEGYSLDFGFLGFVLLLSLTQIEHTRELRENNEKTQAANQAKTSFLTTMSHELRTPMNAVLGINTLLNMTRLTQEQRDYLQKLEIAAKHMLRLIDNILDFAKIEQRGISLNPTAFQLNTILDDIKLILRDQALAKQLNLVIHKQFDKKVVLIGDATRLTQVLLNLASNAIKFTERGRIDLFVYEQTSSQSNQQTLYFEISDTGIGMSDEELTHLFQPFMQIHDSHNKRYGGSGLGLVISQRIVRAMGGELEVASILAKGSRFFFTLQFAKQTLAEQNLAITLAQSIESNRYKHILLVDDDEINRFVACRFLAARQIEVSLAATGEEAIQLLVTQKPPFDMIFMDVSMPDMNGYQTTKKIRAMGFNTVPIVALTAHAINGERERCVAAGMNDFFTKPFELHDLELMVYKWTET